MKTVCSFETFKINCVYPQGLNRILESASKEATISTSQDWDNSFMNCKC